MRVYLLSLSLVIGVYPGTLGVQLPSLRVVSVCPSAQMCTRVLISVGSGVFDFNVRALCYP